MNHESTWEPRRPLRLEKLIPSLLLAIFLLDACARFLPLEYLAFRADEALSQFPSFGGPGVLEPNRHFVFADSYGDLAAMGNFADHRVYREQTFTTDEFGFRNVPRPGEPPPSVLNIGTSFTMGGNIRDEETLSSRLEALSGCRVYNAGGFEYVQRSILALTRRLQMRRGLVIVECLERYVGKPELLQDHARLLWLPSRDRLVSTYRAMRQRLEISPLKIVCQKLYKMLRNDLLLPKMSQDGIPIRTLNNGAWMLFLRDIERPKPYWGLDGHVSWITGLREQLRASGLDLAVVILPDKLTVYRPLLRDPVPANQDSVAFLGEFEHKLQDQHVPVVNLAPILIDEARQALDRNETIYWLDDTHWDPKGIDIAARAISRALDLSAWCRRSTPGVR
jgi:hypothetical protein